MAASCGFALWRGGRPERAAAATCLAAWVATRLAYNSGNWIDPQWGVLAVDVAFLAVLVYLALTTDRAWLLFAAAFQLLGVAIHVAITIDRGIRASAYISALVIWSYLILLSLSWGAWSHWRERRLAEG
jgi:hypothetical protein